MARNSKSKKTSEAAPHHTPAPVLFPKKDSMEMLAEANAGLDAARENHERDYMVEVGKLNEKEKELVDRIDELNKAKLKVAENNGDVDVSGEDLVEINAGGKTVSVTRSTLTQFKGTRLEALFSGRWDKKLIRDDAGRIFLDVNPVCFQAIVDSLNEVKISTDDCPAAAPSVDPELKDILMHQIDLFGLKDFLFPVELPDSSIVKDLNHAKTLHDWLDDDGSDGDLVLLYRSSRDGRSDSTFHAKCDNKGPTLTVVETSDGHFLGGYSDLNWACNCTYQTSKEAFLFAISPTAAFIPSKIKLLGSNDNYAICCHKSYGPTFGSGNDFRVQAGYVYLYIGNTYESAPIELAGSRSYPIKEMEVFQVVRHSNANLSKKQKVVVDAKPATTKNDVQNFSSAINSAINLKWAALAEVESEIIELQTSFDDEEGFITFFSRKNDQEYVPLNVCGTSMATTRHTLQLYLDSTLAAKVLDKMKDDSSNRVPVEDWNTDDVVAWLNTIDGLSSSVVKNFEEDEVTGRELLSLGKEGLKDFGVTKRGTIFYILSEIEKLKRTRGEAATILVEHSPYCFERIIDHLRVESMFLKGLIQNKPGLPVVRASEKSRFEKVVKHYFPGDSSKIILGK
jgi:hypothetical protein